MTATLFSSREDCGLLSLVWPGLDTWSRHWERLFEVLIALEHETPTLGPARGELGVDVGTVDPHEPTTWPLAANAQGVTALRTRLAGMARIPEPYELVLRCEPVAFVPDGQLRATRYDMEDIYDLGEVPLVAVDRDHWRIVGPPRELSTEPLLVLSGGFSITFGAHLVMSLHSYYDLWRPTGFDGEPKVVGAANAEILRACFTRLAAATGGELQGMALEVSGLR